MSIPSHIPAELVIDFNHQSGPEYVKDPLAAWDKARAIGPLLYTAQLGGYWVATDPELISDLLMQPDIFSSRQLTIPAFAGPPMVPVELDPPIHGKYRKLLLPFFTPRMIDETEPLVTEVIEGLLNDIDPSAEFDFCHAFAHPLPAYVITRMLGLEQEDSLLFRGWVEDFTQGATPEIRDAGVMNMRAYLREQVELRRNQNDGGLLSTIAAAEIDGEPIPVEMAESTAFLLTLAGLDTTTSMLTLIWRYLALNPAYRRKITTSDEAINEASEELIRVFTGANPTRYVARDVVWRGYELKAGDLVLVGNTAANRSHGIEPRASLAETGVTSHLGFGHGYHRCVGIHLARKEIRLGLRMWHERFPEYEAATDDFTFVGGNQFQLTSMPLRILR